MAPSDLDGTDPQRFLVDPEMDLAPDPPFQATVLAGAPFAFTLHLDPRAVDQQVQRAVGAAIWDVDSQGFLSAGQRAEVGHGPVETDKPQQAFNEAGRLPQRRAEQHLHRQALLDGDVAVGLLAATPECWRSLPVHL